MKLKKDFALRRVADAWVVLPLGAATIDFNGMLSLNESGALLYRELEQGADRERLVDALTAEYVVDRETAQSDVDAFVQKLRSAGCLEA